MAKGTSSNPADAYRKALRKKELKKNKAERQKTRDFHLVKQDTSELEDEINELEALAEPSNVQKARLTELKTELARINKKKEDYVEAHPEQRALVYASARRREARDKEKENAQNGAGPIVQDRNMFGPDGLPRHPERSVYYDPVFNPYGMPPPGMPYVERALLPGEVNSDAEEVPEEDEDTSDDDIVMPDGPPPGKEMEADEDDDDDIPLPDQPPPSAHVDGPPLPPMPPHMVPTQMIISSHPPLPPLPPGFPPPMAMTVMPPFPPQFLPNSGHAQPPPPPGFLPPPASALPPPPSFLPPPPHMYRPPPSLPRDPTLPPKPVSSFPPLPGSIPSAFASSAQSSSTIFAEPELRDFKKESTAFVPAALKKRQAAAQAQKKNQINSAPVLEDLPEAPAKEDEPEREKSPPPAARPDLLSMLRQKLGPARGIETNKTVKSEAPPKLTKPPKPKDDYDKFLDEMGDILAQPT